MAILIRFCRNKDSWLDIDLFSLEKINWVGDLEYTLI